MWASYTSCCAVPSAGTNSALAVADGYALRPAAPDDAPALFRFGELLLAESSYFLRGPGERARSVAEMRAIIDHFCAQPHYLLLSVWQGETAVGVFTLRKGMVKLVRATADGRERIVRVLRPGDTSVPTLGRGFVEQGAGRFQAHPAVCPAGLILVWFQTYSGLALAEFRTKNDPIPNAF